MEWLNLGLKKCWGKLVLCLGVTMGKENKNTTTGCLQSLLVTTVSCCLKTGNLGLIIFNILPFAMFYVFLKYKLDCIWDYLSYCLMLFDPASECLLSSEPQLGEMPRLDTFLMTLAKAIWSRKKTDSWAVKL